MRARNGRSGPSQDPLWYKDAIIYQLHVKAYFDANDDGIGDFVGLTQKLDHIAELGATVVWLLPFYPSPLRDDGYDIADYKSINPTYGTMHDFRTFVRAAHERGLRVITELVINHTSDQHPWFQRARRAKRGSAYRDFYVWSDVDTKYAGTRIIFTDTETSNWSWDPLAGQYYWHRFFSHQPDLNFESPRVVRAVIDVMRFWLDAGVDGMRLDAVPYLCEREGTSNENLPETHGVLRVLRAVLENEYEGKIFLAEANQWPEDVRAYFGDGDECHMAFHFPLMPRMFMAIAEEDRYPIVDIMRQTPEIPENCQWAIFLRNHDEMTLEMVTNRERDYMYKVYATDPRARINIGIRRRLAPLMENDRRRMELMAGLLMSMPGTPIVYYGDEIGMGDNIYLRDRDGVRTPMQWSIDRNGGFSRSDPARLYLPPVMDAVYGYQTVNVEAQTRSPSSLVNWWRKLIAVRQGYRAFGRGTISFLTPANRKVIAYVREHGNETILCVANLARSPQAVALDLARWRGRIPVEMLGWSPFPTVGADRYVLTLPGHAFYWFLLSEAAVAASWEGEPRERLPELLTLVFARDNPTLFGGRTQLLLEYEILPAYLPKQRWFGAKDAKLPGVSIADAFRFDWSDAHGFFAIVTLSGATEDARLPYLLPLALVEGDDAESALGSAALARTRTGARE
ncbi:MAG: maltose alpha-D-glucosyltransferase, partial [Candidatus Baltobacteraceae bacterium]